MRCPACGEELKFDQRDGKYVCPRCDVFKSVYHSEWKRHRDNVERLMNEIKLRQPILSFKMGLGANSRDWINIPPEKRNEPDIELWWKVHILSIEVTGSAKVEVPPSPIWILGKKLLVAEASLAQGRDYVFYAQYRNGSYVLPVKLVSRHRYNTIVKIIAGNRETYIEIPAEEATPGEKLFSIIEVRMNEIIGGSHGQEKS